MNGICTKSGAPRNWAFGIGACSLLLAGALGAGCDKIDALLHADAGMMPDAGSDAAVAMEKRFAEVHGLVQAIVTDRGGKRRIAVPDVRVRLHAKRCDPGYTCPDSRDTTDLEGWFAIAAPEPGDYELCWDAPGFTPGCRAFVPGRTYPAGATDYAQPVEIAPLGISAAGQLTTCASRPLGVPCRPVTNFDSAHESRAVVVLDDQGKPAARVIASRPNSLGEFIIADLSAGTTYDLVGTAGKATAHTPLKAGVTGVVAVDLANLEPFVTEIQATVNGTPVTRAKAGATVDLQAIAADGDKDAIEYTWTVNPGHGTIKPAADGKALWVLPLSGCGPFIAHVDIKDGKGATYHDRIQIVDDVEPAIFSGRVVDLKGAPVEGVQLTANGVNGDTATTDKDGGFALSATSAETYRVTARKAGYVTSTTVTDGQGGELPIVLVPYKSVTFDPAQGGSVVMPGGDWKPEAVLSYEANAFSDGMGKPPAGKLTLDYAYRRPDSAVDPLSGERTGIDLKKQSIAIDPYSVISLELRDAQGTRFDITRGKKVTLKLPTDPARQKGAPMTLGFGAYDETGRQWIEEGTASLDITDGSYTGVLLHNSNHAVFQKNNLACVRVHANIGDLPLPVLLRVSGPATGGSPFNVVLNQANGIITGLIPNSLVQIDVLAQAGVPIGIAAVNGVSPPQSFSSGGVVLGPLVAANCNSSAVISLQDSNSFLTRMSSTAAEAASYYAEVDPCNERLTLAAWKAKNGFGTDDADAVYGNAGDLGFGRWMHMKRTNGFVAYYVSNYPSADAAASAKKKNLPNCRIQATVAMEYTPTPVSCKNNTMERAPATKFFVFDAQGNRTGAADLDGRGPRNIPGLCQVCHGGNSYAPSQMPPTDALHLEARFLPFDLRSFKYSALFSNMYSRASQEGAFKLLNARILDSTNPSAAMNDMIPGWYGGAGLPQPTQNSAWVPAGWVTPGKSAVYDEAISRACRTCHVSRDPGLDWADWAGLDNFASSVNYDVCQALSMPQAKVTYYNFWLSASPHQPDILKNAGLSGWTNTGACQ